MAQTVPYHFHTFALVRVLELSNNPDDVSEVWLRKLERFVVLLYDRTSTKMRIIEACQQLFSQEEKSIESIPPTKALHTQHNRRAAYQGGHCWGHAIVPVMNLLCSSRWGWIKTDSGWKPLWTTLPDVSSSCDALLTCPCKKGCRSKFSCIQVAFNPLTAE